MPAPDHPVILFDGVCNLCNSTVAWIIRRDRKARFRFASLQSQAATDLLAHAAPNQPPPDSIILLDARGVRTRSDAAIGIAAHLGFPYSLATLARAVPAALRDRAYDLIARNRYRWFGRRESCMIPSPALRARFLDADEPSSATPSASAAPPQSR